MHRLDVNLRDFNREADKLSDLEKNLTLLPPNYQKLVAEIMLLRLFYVFENTSKSIACKVVCGAQYLDGTNPNVFVACRNVQNAIALIQTHGRTKPRNNLKWTKASEIKENLKYVVDASDSLMRTVDNHGSFIDELQRIRNRIAHNNPQSRSKFQLIVLRYYGANLNNVTPGQLLLSPRRSPNLLQQYLIKSKILVREMVKG